MLKILSGFLPWILYFVLVSWMPAQRETAIFAALAAACLLGFKELKKGFILTWGTVVFFAALLVLVWVSPSNWVLLHPNLVTNGALALISWLSLAINKPFTLQYAREQVKKEFWDLPGFLRANQIVTAVWGGSFSVCTAASALHVYGSLSNSMSQTISCVALAFAVWFTIKFPEKYRGKKIDLLIQKADEARQASPFLKGNFAPVHTEIDKKDLPVEGELPGELLGIYMRNGPNPSFTPFSYAYPFDGDGMLHAVYIRDGKASYRNRFIETDQLRAERRLGRAMYGGVDCPFIRDKKLLLPGEPDDPVKFGRFIHIIRHANKYIALHESTSAYEVDAHLATLGEWNPTHATKPIEVNPHPRLDPETGELYLISYHVDRPVITYHVLDKTGKLMHEGAIDVPYCCMIHDFVLTKNYFVLFLCPIAIDVLGSAKGKHIFNWQPELNTQIALVSRKNPSGPVQWIESEPFFNYHFSNAYEIDHEIKIDYVRYPKFTMTTADLEPGNLYRTTIDLHKKSCSHQQLDDRNIELPRINDSKNSSLYRYTYIPCNSIDKHKTEIFNAIVKYDLKTNTATTYDFGPQYEIGEAVFVPRSHSKEEDDGYLMLFAYHLPTQATNFFLLDAKHLSGKPIARITLPQRVPHGLHGSWMPGPW